MKIKFYNQYDSIIQTIRDNPGIKQWEVVQDNRHLTGRGTILTRLKELEDAGVVIRDGRGDKVVCYYLDDTTAFDRLGKPVQKSRHDRLIEETEALMRQTRAVFDKAKLPKIVEPDIFYPIIDRVADFLRAADKPWQSVNKIAATLGAPDAGAVEKLMEAACNDQPEHLRGINVDRDTKKKCDIANDNTVRFYGLVERVEKVATTPVETVETVEAPVAPEASEAPVEAPTPALTLQQIIEQATQAAIELISRDHAVEMARLVTERDAALEQLAAIKKLVA